MSYNDNSYEIRYDNLFQKDPVNADSDILTRTSCKIGIVSLRRENKTEHKG